MKLRVHAITVLTALLWVVAPLGSPGDESVNALVAGEACDQCENHETEAWKHKFGSGSENRKCSPGTCHTGWLTDPAGCGYHDACPGAPCEECGDALVSAGGDVQALVSLINEHPDAVEYNASRRAVQLIGCNDRVKGHFPVSEEIGEALTAHLATKH